MQDQPFVLLLTSIECIHSTSEKNRDDLYFDIYVDDKAYVRYFFNNTLKMQENNEDDGVRLLNIEIDNLSATSKVRTIIRERDDGANDDDLIGEFTITRDDPLEGKKRVTQTSGDAKAIYDVSWRVLSKPIATLRVHGILCQKSSADCNKELIDTVSGAAADAASKASDIIGHVKTPKAVLISDAFAAAAVAINVISAFLTWKANFKEGDDDIYLQQVDHDHPGGDGGAFCPPPDSDVKNIKMDDDDQVAFYTKFGISYFRFPLDKSDVTIKIMDGDRRGSDDCLGSLTIGASQYETLLPLGAQVAVCTDYLGQRGNGQGAVYHLCYSVYLEDWAKDPLPPE